MKNKRELEYRMYLAGKREYKVRALLKTPEGKYLCFITHGGKIALPGGTVEDGETFDGALRREVLEEVGADITNITLLGGYRYKSKLSYGNNTFRLLRQENIYLCDITSNKGVYNIIDGEFDGDISIKYYYIDNLVDEIKAHTLLGGHKRKLIKFIKSNLRQLKKGST